MSISNEDTPNPGLQERKPNRFIQRIKAEPLVPLGIFLTVFALVGSTIGYQRGDSATMQKFMRYRVIAQGFTVIAAMGLPMPSKRLIAASDLEVDN
ncbi:17755_t:CDS:2 [Acaulospora morrowiae]|uniref:17755_t:CDS:1 n=1 Tax=Acaulospora morrowiae TaxID=94023 RepID=A0A9N9EE00_9GLOM|nr:17755_t:CDS:2 [Acaulospora morrowiae]